MTAHSDIVTPDPPCAHCYLSYFCGLERLACEAFERYSKLQRWSDAPRKPSRALFLATFQPRELDEETLRARRNQRRASGAANGTRFGRRPQERQPEATC